MACFTGSTDMNFTVNFNVHCGIAHTRWATHGEPNWVNTHPQRDSENPGRILFQWLITANIPWKGFKLTHVFVSEFIVVHNGILTNYKDVKAFLVSYQLSFILSIYWYLLMYILSSIWRLRIFFIDKEISVL